MFLLHFIIYFGSECRYYNPRNLRRWADDMFAKSTKVWKKWDPGLYRFDGEDQSMPGSAGLRSEVLWGFLRLYPELYSATAKSLNRSFNDIDDASGPNSHRQELQYVCKWNISHWTKILNFFLQGLQLFHSSFLIICDRSTHQWSSKLKMI